MSKHNTAITTIIGQLDTVAAITVGKSLGNDAVGKAIYAVMAQIREDTILRAAEEAESYLVGQDISASNQVLGSREPPVGLETRKTPRQRLFDAAYQYTYAKHLVEKSSDGNPYDSIQTVRSRLEWELNRVHEEAGRKPALTNSVAANAAAIALMGRAQVQEEFITAWFDEIVANVEDAFTELNNTSAKDTGDHSAPEEAENYMQQLNGLEHYQMLLVCVKGLANKLSKVHSIVIKQTPGSFLAQKLSSELGILEGEWKRMHAAASASERDHSKEIIDAMMAGRTIRTLDESDAIVTALGINVAEACAA